MTYHYGIKKAMKKSMFLIPLIMFANLESSYAQTRLEGVYVSEKWKTDYMEFKKDGRFFVKDRLFLKDSKKDILIAGKYEIDDNIITVVIQAFGFSVAEHMQLVNKAIIDDDGYKWVRWEGGENGFAYEKFIKLGALNAERNALLQDVNWIASAAASYWRKPAVLGGGARSFVGVGSVTAFGVDSSNQNGRFRMTNVTVNRFTLTATSAKNGVVIVATITQQGISGTPIIRLP